MRSAVSAVGSVGIYGIDAVDRALKDAAKAANKAGPLGEVVFAAAQHAAAYATEISHVWTGALQESHSIDQAGGRAVVYPNPAVINPISLKSPAEYGPYEHARGGSHAFYARTINERGTDIAQGAIAALLRYLP